MFEAYPLTCLLKVPFRFIRFRGLDSNQAFEIIGGEKDHIFTTSHDRFPPNGGLLREISYFREI